MKRLGLLAFVALLMPASAWAACTNTVSVLDSGGTARTFCRGTDGGSNYLSNFNPVDAGGINPLFPTAAAMADAFANPTVSQAGVLLEGFNGTTWDRLRDDTNKYLYVDIGAGAVTANAGTNLNTSALALETGGNLATTATNTGTTNTDIGPPGATACSTDTGSCSINALAQRIAQRLTTVNTTLGAAPMQSTGGTVGLVAASAIIGKVGIDQTTVGTTNAVSVPPSSAAAVGITPVVSAALEGSHVLKASAGNLYSLYVTTGTTAGYLMTFNATSAPADGAVTPIDCASAPANATTSITFNGAPPDVYSTGITAVFSTTGCFTKTISATAFFKGRIQ
jgi:hypothetical protein